MRVCFEGDERNPTLPFLNGLTLSPSVEISLSLSSMKREVTKIAQSRTMTFFLLSRNNKALVLIYTMDMSSLIHKGFVLKEI